MVTDIATVAITAVVAAPGRPASCGKRDSIAAFDVIAAGSSSAICPRQRLHMAPQRTDRLCNATTGFTSLPPATRHHQPQPQLGRNGKNLAMKLVQVCSERCLIICLQAQTFLKRGDITLEQQSDGQKICLPSQAGLFAWGRG